MWRRDAGGSLEVLVVHRPQYDDWSLPKGKLDPGERHEQAALREVEEETGYRCLLGDELPGTAYRDRHGRAKEVRYWAMTVAGGGFAGEHEVDEVRWLPVAAAVELLSYRRDADLVAAFAARADAAPLREAH